MKLSLEATPDELREKGPQLLKALAARLGVDLKSLVDTLEKSEASGPTSHYGPIQGLVKRSSKVYNDEMTLMLEEIQEVLDKASEG